MMWLCSIWRRDFPGGADGKKKGHKRKRRAGGEGVVPRVRHVCVLVGTAGLISILTERANYWP